ncbi:MAG: hypothetical protein P1U57_14080 [Oleibacter sp.]|nr:hypothetical protein [Thalassolituus sp.]
MAKIEETQLMPALNENSDKNSNDVLQDVINQDLIKQEVIKQEQNINSKVVVVASYIRPQLIKFAQDLSVIASVEVVHRSYRGSWRPDDNDRLILVGNDSVNWFRGTQTAIAIWADREVIDASDYLASAIYLEPPLFRQYQLTQIIFGEIRVSALYSDVSAKRYANELAKLKVFGVTLINYDDSENINYALNEAFKQGDVLLGIDDSMVYDNQNIKNILISAYRRSVPLVGPSYSFLKAGAIATTYSTVEDIHDRLSELLRLKFLPPANYNPYYHIGINEQVARSLNINIPNDKKALQQMLQRLQAMPND